MNIGTIVMFAGNYAPTGWLICDGSAISRTSYSALFDIIGLTYGPGDGVTTFNIPDLKGKVIIGSSESYPVSSVGGEEDHQLTSQEIPSHYHSIAQHGHSNNITATTPVMTHTVTQQPAFTYIKSSFGNNGYLNSSGYKGYYSNTNKDATVSVPPSIANHGQSNCIMSGGIDNCGEFNTESNGIGEGHSNMQPFITLNYIIYVGD